MQAKRQKLEEMADDLLGYEDSATAAKINQPVITPDTQQLWDANAELAFGLDQSQFLLGLNRSCFLISATIARMALGFYELHCCKPANQLFDPRKLIRCMMKIEDEGGFWSFAFHRITLLTRQWDVVSQINHFPYPQYGDLRKLEAWTAPFSKYSSFSKYTPQYSFVGTGLHLWNAASSVRPRAEFTTLLNRQNLQMALIDIATHTYKMNRYYAGVFTQGVSSCSFIVHPCLRSHSHDTLCTAIFTVIDSHGAMIPGKTAGGAWHVHQIDALTSYVHRFLTCGDNVQTVELERKVIHGQRRDRDELHRQPETSFEVCLLTTEVFDAKEPDVFVSKYNDPIRNPVLLREHRPGIDKAPEGNQPAPVLLRDDLPDELKRELSQAMATSLPRVTTFSSSWALSNSLLDSPPLPRQSFSSPPSRSSAPPRIDDDLDDMVESMDTDAELAEAIRISQATARSTTGHASPFPSSSSSVVFREGPASVLRFPAPT